MPDIDYTGLSRFLVDEAKDPVSPILGVGENVGSWKVLAYLGGGGFGDENLHSCGYIHRDIKPSNILYRNNTEAVLVDYGLVKQRQEFNKGKHKYAELTSDGTALGSQKYAAPEQLTGSIVDIAADIHAIGVLADTCFHGGPPWRWNRIIRRATSSLPRQRYASCKALSRAIRFRFFMEFEIGMTVVVLVVLGYISICAHSEEKKYVYPGPTTGGSVHKNVSDSAGEWLNP